MKDVKLKKGEAHRFFSQATVGQKQEMEVTGTLLSQV